MEVGGGCFCCRYDDFDEKLASLAERERPDAVFAESVGSCADIVATVIKPFEAFRGSYGGPSAFSVFADSRLLLARLSGRRLPFSEEVLYVFDRQLEEAELLVLNKRDLLGEAEGAELRALAEKAWPGKARIEISGSTEEGAAAWLAALDAPRAPGPLGRLELDYERYGAGEAELAWLDERLAIEDEGGLASDGSRCRSAVLAFARSMARGLAEAGMAVGHLKLQVSAPPAGAAPAFEAKLSLTASDFLPGAPDPAAVLEARLGPFSARRVMVSLNARVQAAPEALAALAAAAAEAARREAGVRLREEDRSAFSPDRPRPTHRPA